MSCGLLYYIEGANSGIELEGLYAFLAYAFPGEIGRCGTAQGPDGHGGGVVIAIPKLGVKIGFYPDKQTWQRIPDSGDVVAYVGFYNNARPMPEDLQRKNVLPGYWVTLADGNKWLAPIARGQSEDETNPGWHNSLPQITALDKDGNWEPGAVSAQYLDLWDMACLWWDHILGALKEDEAPDEDGLSFDFAGINDAALVCLSANYRVSKAVVALLGLFDTQSTTEILQASVDWPKIEAAAEKKTRGDGLNTAAGPEADTEPTGQA